jgi:hypothetical protein
MTVFQLDQNINAKDLAKQCNDEGRCSVLRFPRRLVDEDDDVVLPDVLSRPATFVTTDRRIIEENPDSVPSHNPGVIVVRTNSKRTLTELITRRIVSHFKNMFIDWAHVDWSRLYIEINEDDVYVTKLINGDIGGGQEIKFNDEEFSEKLSTAVRTLRAALPAIS